MHDTRARDTVVRVVARGAVGLAAARHRLEALRSASHAAIAIPSALELTAQGDVVAHTPRVAGVDLATLLRMRDGLTAGECVTVGVAVAKGLAALHAAGLAHGDVSPSNVVASGRRAVLVDALEGADAGVRGTPGFAAPERAVAATPAGDVYALGRVLEHVASSEARERVGAWTAPMTAASPDERPSAAACAEALLQCAPARSVRVPELGIASSVRAAARTDLPPTLKDPAGRAWRVRRRAATWVRRVGFAAGAGIVLLACAAWIASPRAASEAATPAPVVAYEPASDAAVSLVERRFEAIARGDGAALLATTAPYSAARDADLAPAAALEDGTTRYEGLAATIGGVDLIADDGASASVRVTYAVSAHAVETTEERVEVPARVATVVVDVAWGDDGWAISEIREAT